VFSIFKRKPKFQDAAFQDLAHMLWQDDEAPTYKRELLDALALDFSVDSLAAIDRYLDAIRLDKLEEGDLLRIVLRCGAYVGEVVRRHSSVELHWVDYDEAARESKLVRDIGRHIGTMGVLRGGPDQMCFPLGKVSKFIENGREDSVLLFAKVIVSTIAGANPPTASGPA
jgi:hypothetical protein